MTPEYIKKRDELLTNLAGDVDENREAGILEGYSYLKRAADATDQLVAEEVRKAEARGVAFAIKQIDALHIGMDSSATTDHLLKGIKNDIRARFESLTGVDPAPDYPVSVELQSQAQAGSKQL